MLLAWSPSSCNSFSFLAATAFAVAEGGVIGIASCMLLRPPGDWQSRRPGVLALLADMSRTLMSLWFFLRASLVTIGGGRNDVLEFPRDGLAWLLPTKLFFVKKELLVLVSGCSSVFCLRLLPKKNLSNENLDLAVDASIAGVLGFSVMALPVIVLEDDEVDGSR